MAAWPRRAADSLRLARRDVAAAQRSGQIVLALMLGLLAPLCLLYCRMPHDLIPTHSPVIGRLDDLVVIAAGLALLRQAASRLARLAPDFADDPPGLLAAFLRGVALDLFAHLAAPLLYRATLGTWPTAAARRDFVRGLSRRDIPLPPVLRGLAQTEAGTVQIRTLLQLSLPAQPGARLLPLASGEPRTIPPLTGDPLAFWHGRPVAFLHVEKSAGTSVLASLTTQFHPGQIDPDPRRTLSPHALTRLQAQADAARDYDLVWGHYDLPYLRLLGPDRFLVLFLRNPVRRILSLYRYWRSVHPDILATDDVNHTVHFAHTLTLEEFLDCRDPLLIPAIDNIYARRLTGAYQPDLPADTLPQALQALNAIHFIGLTETIDASLAGLARTLGFPPPQAAPRANVTDDIIQNDKRFRPAPAPVLTENARASLLRLTRLDREIYAAARPRAERFRP
jgi:uncharacterized membrane protein YkvA (DUF1232 family)